MKTDKELEEIGYTKCDFSDTCDLCNNPKGGTFAVGYTNDMCGEELDHYVCRKCATKTYDEDLAYMNS